MAIEDLADQLSAELELCLSLKLRQQESETKKNDQSYNPSDDHWSSLPFKWS